MKRQWKWQASGWRYCRYVCNVCMISDNICVIHYVPCCVHLCFRAMLTLDICLSRKKTWSLRFSKSWRRDLRIIRAITHAWLVYPTAKTWTEQPWRFWSTRVTPTHLSSRSNGTANTRYSTSFSRDTKRKKPSRWQGRRTESLGENSTTRHLLDICNTFVNSVFPFLPLLQSYVCFLFPQIENLCLSLDGSLSHNITRSKCTIEHNIRCCACRCVPW